MLIGEYESKIGEKKRVAIPQKFKKELGGNLILTRGYEGTLVLVNKKMWEEIAKEVINGSFINKDIRDTTRFLVGSATEIQPDQQGRIVIPKSLYEYAEFKQQAIFVGLYNWIEIWDKNKWSQRLKYLDKNSEEIAKAIQEMNRGDEK